ncbi:MAG: hypothetical protein U9O94_10665, partial [Nanoarchaeota archaeon]|nr:hypothetical protein [Nanoarchaeota archaeon]
MSDQINNKSKKTIAEALTAITVDTEGLLPNQTPIRDTKLSVGGRDTSRFKNTVLGEEIDWQAHTDAPSNRKNFYYVKSEESRNKAINKQWSRYLNLQTQVEGLSPDTTLREVIGIFDKQNPQNKEKLMEKQGFDLDAKIKDLEAKAPTQGRLDEVVNIFNIFDVKNAEAAEVATTGRLDELTFAQKFLSSSFGDKMVGILTGDMSLIETEEFSKEHLNEMLNTPDRMLSLAKMVGKYIILITNPSAMPLSSLIPEMTGEDIQKIASVVSTATKPLSRLFGSVQEGAGALLTGKGFEASAQ